MELTWHGNFQVKTSTRTPQSSHGPALATFNDLLYMVYAGEGGRNLWFSYSDGGGDFHNWQGDRQIKVSGADTPLTSDRPALAVVDGMMHLVYAGEGGASLWWSWFDGSVWRGNVRLPFAGSQPQPALAAFDGKLHLVFHDLVHPVAVTDGNGQVQIVSPGHSYIYHTTFDPKQPFELDNWQRPSLVSDGGRLPALAESDGGLALLLSPIAGPSILRCHWNGSVWSPFAQFASGAVQPESSGGLAIAAQGAVLHAAYPGEGGSNLWYSSMSESNVVAGNVQIHCDGSTPETSAPIGLAMFRGELCVAYKGESSNNLWFSHSRPPPSVSTTIKTTRIHR